MSVATASGLEGVQVAQTLCWGQAAQSPGAQGNQQGKQAQAGGDEWGGHGGLSEAQEQKKWRGKRVQWSIPGNRRIDVGPGVNATGNIGHMGKAAAFQKIGHLHAACAVVA